MLRKLSESVSKRRRDAVEIQAESTVRACRADLRWKAGKNMNVLRIDNSEPSS